MPVLTVSDAARAIGHRSRSQLYRLIDAGRLDSHIRHQDGRRFLESEGLSAAVRDATQQRRTSITPTQDTVPVDWERVARVANSYLGENFGPPPWDERKWLTLWVSLQDALAGWPEAIETDDLD
jgi:hypothetical protein